MFRHFGQWLRAYAEKDGRGYPDWALRYIPIVKRLERDGLVGKRILEVGANECGFSRFANVPVVAVDIAREHLAAARAAPSVTSIQADLTNLPFFDGCFDVCVCIDTLEHITAAGRPACIRELCRVLSPNGRFVLAFPSGKPAQDAEARVRDAYWRHTGGKLKWLEEHATENLPDASSIQNELATILKTSYDVQLSKNANLRIWEWMWLVLMCGWPGRGNAVFQVILRLLTPLIARMNLGRCYRAVIVAGPKR